MLAALVKPIPAALGGSRTVFRLFRTALHLLWGSATVALVFPFVPLPARRALKQRWSKQLIEILGFTLVSSGARPGGLIVSNHISFVDIFVINAIAPTAFVSKNDLLNWPIIGWLSRHTETIFLQRGSRRAAQETKEALTDYLRSGGSAAVFPEGTTTLGDRVLPFHGAMIQAAIDAGVPLTPMALRYRTRGGANSITPAYVDDITLWECIRAIVSDDGLVADVRVLAPLVSDGLDRRHLAALAHRVIAHAMEIL